MVTSAEIQKKIVEYLSSHSKGSLMELKKYLSAVNMSGYTPGQFAGSITTLVRNGTIAKTERGVYSLIRTCSGKRCIFLLPADVGGDASTTDKLLRYVINPVCESCGIETVTAVHSVSEEFDVVITDISSHAPDVFYEIGRLSGCGRALICLKNKHIETIADIDVPNVLEYDLTDLDSVEMLKDRLRETIDTLTRVAFSSSSDAKKAQDSSIRPLIYRLFDSIDELKKDIERFAEEILSVISSSGANAQPDDSALKLQLLNSFLQNPDGFVKLVELSDKNKRNN